MKGEGKPPHASRLTLPSRFIYSGLMPASFTTLAHLSYSPSRCCECLHGLLLVLFFSERNATVSILCYQGKGNRAQPKGWNLVDRAMRGTNASSLIRNSRASSAFFSLRNFEVAASALPGTRPASTRSVSHGALQFHKRPTHWRPALSGRDSRCARQD